MARHPQCFSANFAEFLVQIFVAAGFSLRFLCHASVGIPQAKACGYESLGHRASEKQASACGYETLRASRY
jgi:hypothetical protein